jgi:hypothetical protein
MPGATDPSRTQTNRDRNSFQTACFRNFEAINLGKFKPTKLRSISSPGSNGRPSRWLKKGFRTTKAPPESKSRNVVGTGWRTSRCFESRTALQNLSPVSRESGDGLGRPRAEKSCYLWPATWVAKLWRVELETS